MLELEQLIQKFWTNQTTPAENRRLILLLEQYKEVYKDAAQFDFRENEGEPIKSLQPDKALSILQNLHKTLGIGQEVSIGQGEEQQGTGNGSVRRLFRRLAVAASVCIIAGGAFLLTARHEPAKPIAGTAVPIPPRLIRLVNGPDSTIAVYLNDGSTVQLGKNSSLSWYEPFINDRRDLSLNGSALFKVAKDRKRPFTVYAGGIATRALGTRFLVNASDARKVKVRLLEGKIVVNTMTGSGMTMNDVYLNPGQEFSFDKGSRRYAVSTLPDKPGNAAKPAVPDKGSELIFKKEPLGMVFKRVGDLYKVPLTFQKEELDGLYFTGTFLKSDDLNLVLSTICNVNDLLFTKEQDSIIITKQH